MLQRKPDVSSIENIVSVIAERSGSLAADTSDDTGELIDPAGDLERIAAEALDQLRQLTNEHANLTGQVAALERQVRTLLIERLELSAQVAALQRELTQARSQRGAGSAPLGRPTAVPRPEAITPFRSGLGATHRSALQSNHDTALRQREMPTETAPLAGDGAAQAPADYILVAQPFGRFSDLGRFQTAIQGLRGVQNARVRRFAQGTLEMRLEYDGVAPLKEALSELALAVDAIEQIDPQRLVIRLRPDSLI